MPLMPPENVTATNTSVQSKSYLLPLILVTSLFFLWGLANILNSALIAHFQPVFEISRAQALLVETAFYFGYFTVAIPAGLFMEKYSYKKGILMGLLLYAVGALLFIPAAKLLTFGFFLVALYIIASGLAFLETGANPYVMLLGKKETSSVRLNFAQSFNGVALVVGPLIAGHFIFSGNEGTMGTLAEKQQAADAVILPYVGIAAIVFLVAILFFFSKMPEPDKGKGIKFDRTIFKQKHLMLAVIAQLFYVGAQVGLWGITIDFVTRLLPGTSKEDASKFYLLGGTFMFVTGRFIGTFLMNFIKDHKLLMIYALAAMLLCLAGAFGTGLFAVVSFLTINFFMSIMFPTIFALGVRDLGDNTKLGASLIIMAIVGGAILPPLMGLISLQYSLFIPLISFAIIFYYGFEGYKVKS
jgi:MFS transporter, FHS family, L-fucose permease